jgi:hypothetical protein
MKEINFEESLMKTYEYITQNSNIPETSTTEIIAEDPDMKDLSTIEEEEQEEDEISSPKYKKIPLEFKSPELPAIL